MSRQLLPLPVIPLQIFIALCAFALPHVTLAAEAETTTLSSGEVQFEFKLSDTQNKRDAAEYVRTGSSPFLLRVGLPHQAELRVETPGAIRAVTTQRSGDENGLKTTQKGGGDATIGLRWRSQEADSESNKPALAWMLVAGLPVGSAAFKGSGVSTNINFTAEWELGHELSIAVMPGLLRDKNASGARFIAPTLAVTLGKNWTPPWDTVIEVVASRISHKNNGGSDVTLNLDNTYVLNKNIELEAVFLRGITKQTANKTVLFGFNLKL